MPSTAPCPAHLPDRQANDSIDRQVTLVPIKLAREQTVAPPPAARWEGAVGGDGGSDGARRTLYARRMPQSPQSHPRQQSKYSAPDPPSLRLPSNDRIICCIVRSCGRGLWRCAMLSCFM